MIAQDYIEGKHYHETRKKVREIRMFYMHLIAFILISLILIVINFMTSPQHLWFIWCLLGGVTGVVIHGLQAFGFSPILNNEWEKRKIDEILEKENNKQKWE